MATEVKLPVLLDGHSLTSKQTLTPISLSLTETGSDGIGISTANMILPLDQYTVAVNNWVRLYTIQGDRGVYRVTAVKSDYQRNQITVSLEHLWASLNDTMIYDEIKPEDIQRDGNPTLAKAVRYLLDKQVNDPIYGGKLWRLSTVDIEDDNPYNFGSMTLMNAVSTVLQAVEEYRVEYVMTELPFAVKILNAASDPTCEMRMNRNIESISIDVNKNGMYTRIYPTGYQGLELDEKYLERNVATYGVIESMQNCDQIDNQKQLRKWARARLKKYSQPLVTVSINGYDLSTSTGEPMDKLTLGSKCRVPLAEYKTSVTETITQLQWTDLISKPDAVQMSLANDRRTLTSILKKKNEDQKRSGGSKHKDDKDKKEKDVYYRTWMNKTDEEIELGAARTEKLTTDIATLNIRANKIESRVTKTENGITTAESRITQLANRVSIVVDGNGNIKPAQIVAAINNGSSEVLISANKITFDGSTTVKGQLNTLTAVIEGRATASSLRTDSFTCNGTATIAAMTFGSSREGVTTYTVNDTNNVSRRVLGLR